ncbi:MAG: HEAT repeat domain-containing protein [Gemmata sp.]|nr:HEAT repeat domain-containing protein [Gemmata sp.]
MTTADDPLPALMAALRSSCATERLRAAKDLGRLGWLARDALPALVAVLNDSDHRVRESAAQAIGSMGPDALPTLVAMLGHSDKYVRRHAVWALGKLGPLARPALAELCSALKDTDPRTASGAAQALGSMGADAAEGVPALAEAMRGTNIVLCRLASKALSQIGFPALPTLIAHLHHADPFVRAESALAIGWMGPAAEAAIPHLAQVVQGPQVPLTPSPTAAVPNPSGPLAVSDSQAVTPPQVADDGTLSPEVNCRVYAAQALGRIGSAALPALLELQQSLPLAPEPVGKAVEQALRLVQGAS